MYISKLFPSDKYLLIQIYGIPKMMACFFLARKYFLGVNRKMNFLFKNENDRRFNIAFRVLFAVMVILLKRQILP